MVLNTYVYWLRRAGRCREVIETAERAIQIDPKRIRTYTGVYNELARCKLRTGRAEESIELQAKADQLNPRSPWKYTRYHQMGFASLLLGRYADAVTLIERSIALNPEVHESAHLVYRWLAVAYAGTGQIGEARRWLSAADGLWPYFTVRGVSPEEPHSLACSQRSRCAATRQSRHRNLRLRRCGRARPPAAARPDSF